MTKRGQLPKFKLYTLLLCLVFVLMSGCSANQKTDVSSASSSKNVTLQASSKASSSKVSTKPSSSAQSVESEVASSRQSVAGEAVVLNDRLRGMWISFFEIQVMCESKKGFRYEFAKALDQCADYGTNSVYVHVRSHCDAYYKSDIFPWSVYVTGEQGKAPDFDPLEIMIEEAHKRDIQIHAWINPYRVSTQSTDLALLSDLNPAKKWLTDDDETNDYRVVECDGGLYLNPCDIEVQRLIVDGVREIVKYYNVDGVHFDDYFYPTTEEWFDEPQYAEYLMSVSSNPLSLDDWRRANVNSMVGAVYNAVKDVRSNCIFGISPMASIENNYHTVFADIKAWLDGGYVDYVMPQLYFGFEYPSEKSRFDVLLDQWIKLFDNYEQRLYIGLGAYRIGSTDVDNIEWSEHNDILSRQLKHIDSVGKTDGYVIYSYQTFFKDDERTAAERQNLLNVIAKNEETQ